jgi:hypothetical protein
MLVFKPRFITEIWFSNKIERSFFTVYYQSSYYRKLYGMISEKFYTKIIDLTAKETDIYNDFDKATKQQIRIAGTEGVIITDNYNIDQIITFYNNFAKSKELNLLDEKNIRNSPYNLFTIAKINDEILVCHLCLLDKSKGRVRILKSGSNITSERALIGRANRFLHYWEMIHFKNLGFSEYDLGGYAFNTKNSCLKGINFFKDSFGGKLILEYHYYPIHIWIIFFIKDKLNRVVNRLRFSVVELNKKAIKIMMRMQQSDEYQTYADKMKLKTDFGHKPTKMFKAGISVFVKRYKTKKNVIT